MVRKSNSDKETARASLGIEATEDVYVEVLVDHLGTYRKGDVTDDPSIVALLGDGTGRVGLAPKPRKKLPTEGLIEGCIVHYVLPEGPNAGESRPAIVVKVWDKDSGCANLNVFTDGENDGVDGLWVTSVCYSDTHEPRTWHWIPKA